MKLPLNLRPILSISGAVVLTGLFVLFMVTHHPQSNSAPTTSQSQAAGHKAVTQESAWQLRQAAITLLDKNQRADGLALLNELKNVLDSDPEWLAWLGSAQVMQAMDARSSLEKMAMVDQGLTTLNAAVLAAPFNLNCRIIQARTCLSLPDFFPDERSKGIDALAVVADWSTKGFQPFVTNDELQQIPQTIDPVYLAQTIQWARNQVSLSDKDIHLLEKLADSVQITLAKSSKISASKETKK